MVFVRSRFRRAAVSRGPCRAVSGGYAGCRRFFVISRLSEPEYFTAIDAGRFSTSGLIVNTIDGCFPALLVTVGVTYLVGALLLHAVPHEKLAEAAIVSVPGPLQTFYSAPSGLLGHRISI